MDFLFYICTINNIKENITMKAKISKEQFLDEVRQEIESLKVFATQDELNNLNFDAFEPTLPEACIYGQLTGYCASFRAKELMDKSCVRVTTPKHDFDGFEQGDEYTFDEMVFHLGKPYNKQTWKKGFVYKEEDKYSRNYAYLSMLEVYISLNNANNENVLAYLKGETDSIILDTI